MRLWDRIRSWFGWEPKPKRITSCKNFSRDIAEAALAEAETKLSKKYRGKYGIKVVGVQGQHLGGGWWGDKKTNTAAQIAGTADRQTVTFYLDPKGNERWPECVHEMAHAVLFGFGQFRHPAEYTKTFENWYD